MDDVRAPMWERNSGEPWAEALSLPRSVVAILVVATCAAGCIRRTEPPTKPATEPATKPASAAASAHPPAKERSTPSTPSPSNRHCPDELGPPIAIPGRVPGPWASTIDRWRPAIEGYVPRVRDDNKLQIGTRAPAIASYLNSVHNRLHPIFAVDYLGFLETLSGAARLPEPDLRVTLEVIVRGEDGALLSLGVVEPSGRTVFDLSALIAFSRAAAYFEKPPAAALSEDGRVYLHWELHREPKYACSTYFARPYRLKADDDCRAERAE